MRQVGDRLIPVGVTSGRVHAINGEDGQPEANDTGRRSRRRNQQQSGFDQLLGGMAGQDLEELMIMEAMRLSLIEHEEQQRKEAEEKKKKAAEEAAKNPTSSPAGPSNLEIPPTQDQPSALPTSTSHSQSNTQLSLPPSSSSVVPTPNSGSASSSRGDRSDADTSLIHRPNPPPFSTLNAALCATSTASAFLRASDVTPSSQETNHEDAHAATVDTPAIDTAQKSSSQQAQEDASSILEPSSSYNVLPSSPEPDSANEALLGGSISQSSLPASNTSGAPP
ncbi:hypothetical protein ONZ45_g18195 [Pleurotus djamor]|nr:hypothetical protein ONZ45_g18195 [Pleurotus djamor]